MRDFVESMDFNGTHGISRNPRIIHGLHEVFMESTKFSWNPRTFHGFHEVFMKSTKFPWALQNFHGTHEIFMESTNFPWTPRSFHGIQENYPRNFHKVPGIHRKANWIVLLGNFTFNFLIFYLMNLF